MSIRDLAPCPQLANNDADVVRVQPSVIDHEVNVDSTPNAETYVVEPSEDSDVSINVDLNGKLNETDNSVRRFSQSNKGVPPPRYMV